MISLKHFFSFFRVVEGVGWFFLIVYKKICYPLTPFGGLYLLNIYLPVLTLQQTANWLPSLRYNAISDLSSLCLYWNGYKLEERICFPSLPVSVFKSLLKPGQIRSIVKLTKFILNSIFYFPLFKDKRPLPSLNK